MFSGVKATFRSIEFSGLVAPENCREFSFGYGVVYLAKNDMATLKLGFIFITPHMKAFLRSFFLEKSDLSRNRLPDKSKFEIHFILRWGRFLDKK